MDRRVFLAGGGAAALAAGQARGNEGDRPAVQLRMEGEDLYAELRNRPLLRYRRRIVEPPAGANALLASNGYLHPVHAPNGAVVTDHLSPDHPHQRGIFSAWTKTKIEIDGQSIEPDFWNIHQGTGRTRSEAVEILRGEVPGFRTRHLMEVRRQNSWLPVLDEAWEVRFPNRALADPNAPGAAYVIDITSRQTPRRPIELPKYHYGGFGVRGSARWEKSSDVRVLNSEGKDRAGADQTKARWVDMSGTVDGQVAGIALLEHPNNPHAPNGVRVHATMPYYVFALPQSGPIVWEAGKEYVFRYRVVTHNGRTDKGLLDSLWTDFARQKA